jgi:hypothetical protein
MENVKEVRTRIMMSYRLDNLNSVPITGEIFLFSIAERPALGPTQPPIHYTRGVKLQGVKLTTHLHLVPRSRMVELYIRSLTTSLLD